MIIDSHAHIVMPPESFRGVASLPQYRTGCPSVQAVAELERCVNELGFVGCLINPDPPEGAEAPLPAWATRSGIPFTKP